MSYLRDYLNTTNQTGPKVKIHLSLESLINELAPKETRTVQEPLKKDPSIELYEQAARKIMESPFDLEQKTKIDEEIKNDLENEFSSVSLETDHILNESLSDSSIYKLYRDRDETFECKISVEGTSLNNTLIRLILETDSWNIFFIGKIYKDGRCVVPLKRMSIFPEGTIGKARLEVIIDEILFIPWEEAFKVEGAKKVTVEVMPQTKVSVNITPTE